MEYNVVEDLKKIKENISIMDLCKISQQCKLLVNALRDEKDQPLISSKFGSKIDGGNTHKATINTALNEKRSKSLTPPFLLTFEIFNQNVHNFLVDSGASSNVMPYYVKKFECYPNTMFNPHYST
jgi:hypothetical protein